MQFISQYFREIIVLLLGIEIINLLIPQKSFGGYIKFISGLLLLTALITPVTGKDMLSFSNLYGNYEGVDYNYTDKVRENYERRVEKELKEKLGITARVKTDEGFNIVSIQTDSDKSTKEAEEYLGL